MRQGRSGGFSTYILTTWSNSAGARRAARVLSFRRFQVSSRPYPRDSSSLLLRRPNALRITRRPLTARRCAHGKRVPTMHGSKRGTTPRRRGQLTEMLHGRHRAVGFSCVRRWAPGNGGASRHPVWQGVREQGYAGRKRRCSAAKATGHSLFYHSWNEDGESPGARPRPREIDFLITRGFSGAAGK